MSYEALGSVDRRRATVTLNRPASATPCIRAARRARHPLRRAGRQPGLRSSLARRGPGLRSGMDLQEMEERGVPRGSEGWRHRGARSRRALAASTAPCPRAHCGRRELALPATCAWRGRGGFGIGRWRDGPSSPSCRHKLFEITGGTNAPLMFTGQRSTPGAACDGHGPPVVAAAELKGRRLSWRRPSPPPRPWRWSHQGHYPRAVSLR